MKREIAIRTTNKRNTTCKMCFHDLLDFPLKSNWQSLL